VLWALTAALRSRRKELAAAAAEVERRAESAHRVAIHYDRVDLQLAIRLRTSSLAAIAEHAAADVADLVPYRAQLAADLASRTLTETSSISLVNAMASVWYSSGILEALPRNIASRRARRTSPGQLSKAANVNPVRLCVRGRLVGELRCTLDRSARLCAGRSEDSDPTADVRACSVSGR
jgi:hypothetical protein